MGAWRNLSGGASVVLLGLATAGCSGGGAGVVRTATPAVPPSYAGGVPLPSPSPSAQTVVYAAQCATSALRLAMGQQYSEATGQNTLGLTLTNTSSRGCYLLGYPGLTYLDAAGRVLPFRYVWGGDQMVTSTPPSRVDLAPGGVAYIAANKYRCDAGNVATAATVQVIPPNQRAALSLSLANRGAAITWCGNGDPGSVVGITPVEPTFLATVATH